MSQEAAVALSPLTSNQAVSLLSCSSASQLKDITLMFTSIFEKKNQKERKINCKTTKLGEEKVQ